MKQRYTHHSLFRSNSELPQVMIQMFPLKLSPLFLGHIAKKWMAFFGDRRRVSGGKPMYQHLELFFFFIKITIISYNKTWIGGKISFERTFFHESLFSNAAEYETEKSSFELFFTEGRLQRHLAMSQHLRNIHFAPEGLCVLM